MTKTAETIPEPENKAPVPAPVPIPVTAMDALVAAGREPLRIWKVKGPKGVGGELSAVLCQDDNAIVIVHTLGSGKWSVFGKVAT